MSVKLLVLFVVDARHNARIVRNGFFVEGAKYDTVAVIVVVVAYKDLGRAIGIARHVRLPTDTP